MQFRRRTIRAHAPSIAALLLAGTGPLADAEEVAEAGRSESSPAVVELSEVVVTATKRETKLQETPIAITVFTAEQMESQRLYNLTDIAEQDVCRQLEPSQPVRHQRDVQTVTKAAGKAGGIQNGRRSMRLCGVANAAPTSWWPSASQDRSSGQRTCHERRGARGRHRRKE
jgi:hypothetical protein